MIAGRIITAALVALAGPAMALTPLPPCDGVIESGMQVGMPMPMGEYQSGVAVENYLSSEINPEGRPQQLDGFGGVRLVDCSTGRFITIAHEFDPYEVSKILAATEFLRDGVKGEKPLKYNAVLKAAKAVYPGAVMQFRETAETCGCKVYFEQLRPGSLTPYSGNY